jgi:hypothetical protein
MKTTKFLHFLLLFSLNIALVSCEGETTRTRIIKNNSSGLVFVTASGTDVSNYNKTMSSGQSETLFIGVDMGGSDHVENPAYRISTLLVINEKGDTFTKNY